MLLLSAIEHNETFADRAERTAAQVHDARYRAERDERERRLRRRDTLFAWLRFAIGAVVLAILALLIDGIRRENGELFAHVLSFVPAADVRRAADSKTEPVRAKMNLAHHDLIRTDVNGTATLSFPDGSGVLVQPQTHFEVRLVDYARNGRRNRSFFLRYGGVFSRISKAFGQGGQTLISTPNAVAAARGTGYTVFYDPDSNGTVVEVIESKVRLTNGGGSILLSAGQRGRAIGNAPPQIDALDGPRRTQLTTFLNQLQRNDLPPPAILRPILEPILRAERALLGVLDPGLQLVGVIPGGWNLQDNDNARRLQANRRLQDLQKGLTDEVPERITLHTLAELSLPEEERQRILAGFAHEMLESYRKTGASGYIVRARARDSRNTLYELTETGVREVKP
ncbi:MAG: FecR family protein [Capsulimonadales bacterium]|nr:FecR family protein [Capsulimonadales bacterium]